MEQRSEREGKDLESPCTVSPPAARRTNSLSLFLRTFKPTARIIEGSFQSYLPSQGRGRLSTMNFPISRLTPNRAAMASALAVLMFTASW